jgi:hypothetical protein
VSFAEPDFISRSSGLALVPTSAGNDASFDFRLCKVGHPKLVFQPMAGRTQLKQRAVKSGPQRGVQRAKDSCEQGFAESRNLPFCLPDSFTVLVCLVAMERLRIIWLSEYYTNSFSLELLGSLL